MGPKFFQMSSVQVPKSAFQDLSQVSAQVPSQVPMYPAFQNFSQVSAQVASQ